MMLSYDNSECREVAAELLRRHGDLQAEANITSAVRDFSGCDGARECG